MSSDSEKLMDFEQAIKYMDPMQVTDYLHKILDFLKRNNKEVCFPNISPYVESFLVNLVTDTRNLTCKSFRAEDKRLASEIIDILEMSKDVFRWSHAYENGKMTKNLLVYKKIYSNKIKKKATKPSTIAHRLIQTQAPQTLPTPNQPTCQPNPTNDLPAISTGFKLHILNKTLRFIKNEAETVLVYDEVPSYQAEYINSLFQQHDNDVGFGYKSLYAPLWEAMEVHGVNYMFEMTLQETGDRMTVLKLEKIPRKKNVKNSKEKQEKASCSNLHVTTDKSECVSMEGSTKQNMNQLLNTSIRSVSSTQSSSKSSKAANSNSSSVSYEMALLNNVTDQFVQDTVTALTEFAEDASRASITFDRLSNDELCFVKKVKGLAASKESRKMFTTHFSNLLVKLNLSIEAALKTCKITTIVNEKNKGITLKKLPTFTAPTGLPSTSGVRSKSLASSKARERSLSRDRMIQFQKASKPTIDDRATDKESVGTTERGRSIERGMNKRKAKLLEDLSTPVESDRGIRMMLLMGWKGGALGARGEGITEPLIPVIDMPSKAGLGHVPPPKPAQPRRPIDFRMMLFHNILDLLMHDDTQKLIQYKEPLTKKENNFLNAAVKSLNLRRPLGLCDKEAELTHLVIRELSNSPRVVLRTELSQNRRTLTLIKTDNLPAPLRAIKSKVVKAEAKLPLPPQAVTNEAKVAKEASVTYEGNEADVLITPNDIEMSIPYVDNKGELLDAKNIKKRAVRLVVLMKMADVLRGDFNKITFRSKETMSRKLMTFLKSIIDSTNRCAWNDCLMRPEAEIYVDLQGCARGYALSIEFVSLTKFILRKTPQFNDASNDIAHPKALNNNNNEKVDNQNKIQAIDENKQSTSSESLIELNSNAVENNVDRRVTLKDNEKDETVASISIEIYNEAISASKSDTINESKNIDDDNVNIPIKNGNLKEFDPIGKDDTYSSTHSDKNIMKEEKENVDVETDTECDRNEASDKENDVLTHWELMDLSPNDDSKTLVDDKDQSDLDRDIKDLEIAILKADLNCDVKKENVSDDPNALELAILKAGLDYIKKEKSTEKSEEMAISEAELSFKIKKENDTSPYTKRSRTNSICSQELVPKRSKIRSDEIMVTISPKNHDEKLTEDIARQVQSLISMEFNKCEFLPLLNCYGIEKAGLIYGCHDNEDVAWLKNIISVANLDLEVVPGDDLCLDKKSRKLVIKINSWIRLDVKKVFKNLETYNTGLNTKYWKVFSTHTNSNFVLFIVEVDEKSLKYIAEENFSLYCGIDKAQFSIIF